VVRYAAPAFWKRGELEAAILGRTVLERSGFVDPAKLAGHRVWTYVEAGNRGRANPRGRRHRFETVWDLLRSIEQPRTSREEVVLSDPVPRHLARVGQVARDREPWLRDQIRRWQARLADADIEVSPTQHQAVLDLASVVTLVTRLGGSWNLLDAGTAHPT